jgi:predicted ArsR family transcriptional regulator
VSLQAERLATIAVLGDPLRRDMYLFVASSSGESSRDQVADRFGVSRGVAAFHLDKLADLGLLETEFRRPPGRSGPGAGRPAKFYRASHEDVSFSVPPREYELAGRLLAEAVTVAEREHVPVKRALGDVARRVGRSFGIRARERVDGNVKRKELRDAACEELGAFGYEPRSDSKAYTLANCPFHALAQEYRDLVCGMNLEFLSGFTESLGDAGLEARLEPCPGQCCVRLIKSSLRQDRHGP